jgi:hypothetical protein
MITLKPFRQIDPERLEIRSGGGFLSIFGVPFFLAGIFIVLTSVRILPVENASQVPAWGWPVMLLAGFAFVAVGGGLVFGRSWMIIDRQGGKVLKQWGLLAPMKCREESLASFRTVALRLQAGDSDSADSYQVVLEGDDAARSLKLYSSPVYGDSRERAVVVGQFLRLPMTDATTQHETVLEPAIAGKAFREQIRTAAVPGESFSQPYPMRSRVEESREAVKITIPNRGLKSAALIVQFVFPLVFLCFLLPQLFSFFERTNTPAPVGYFFGGLALLLFVLLPLLSALGSAVGASRGRTVVTCSRDEVTIEEHGAWRTRRTRIEARDILGLDYGTGFTGRELVVAAQAAAAGRGPGLGKVYDPRDPTAPVWVRLLSRLSVSKGVAVKTRAGVHRFGAGLPDDEVQYLYGVLWRVLAA